MGRCNLVGYYDTSDREVLLAFILIFLVTVFAISVAHFMTRREESQRMMSAIQDTYVSTYHRVLYGEAFRQKIVNSDMQIPVPGEKFMTAYFRATNFYPGTKATSGTNWIPVIYFFLMLSGIVFVVWLAYKTAQPKWPGEI